jgi:hypothetical protein
MNPRKLAALVALAIQTLTGHASPPPVIIEVNGNLYENGLFAGAVIQSVPFSLFGAEITFSDQLHPIQTGEAGTFSGETFVSVQASAGAVTLQRNTSLTFTHGDGGGVVGDYLGSGLGLGFYVLGEPGTPFTWGASGGAVTASSGASPFYSDLGYSSPGLVFKWGPEGGTASGSGTSTDTTLIVNGNTYSRINITPNLDEDVFFGFSGPYNYPPVVDGSVQGTFSMNVQNLGLAAKPAQLLNVATRLKVQPGDNAVIAGFIVAGARDKKIIVRAIGPSLAVAGNLADPTLELRDSGGVLIAANDNWRSTQEAEIIATEIAPSHDLESAIVANLPANNAAYTAIVRGIDQGSGIAVVEVYDLETSADSMLVNVSTRGFVQTGNNILIGGFILGGGGADTEIAVRGLGPSLASFGLRDVLADPKLELHTGNGALVASNDNWREDVDSASELSDHGLGLQDPAEAGLFESLAPGAYTVLLTGNQDGVGIGLVEIYNIR